MTQPTEPFPKPISRRADACAVAFALGFPTLVTWVYFVLLAQSPAAMQQAAYTVGKIIQFGFPLVWVLGVQRRWLHWTPPRAADWALGLAFGLAAAGLMLAAYHAWFKPAGYLAGASAAIAAKIAGFGVAGLPQFVAMGFFYSLVHSLLEEYYWRWFAFGQLRGLTSPARAVAISSLAFTGHHIIVLGIYFGWSSPLTVLFSLVVAIGGAIWAWMYRATGSLWGPWISHLLIDAAIFVVGYDLVMYSSRSA